MCYLLWASRAPGVHAWDEILIVNVIAKYLASTVMHWRIDETRADDVHADTLWRQLRGGACGQPDQAVL